MGKIVRGSVNLDTYCNYTPDELILIFTEEKLKGVTKIEFSAESYGGLEVMTEREETPEECEQREETARVYKAKVEATRIKNEAARKKAIILEAKALGLKITE